MHGDTSDHSTSERVKRVRVNNNESRVKDNTFIDTDGDTVLIALWNDRIHQIQHDSGYTISRMKYRQHNGNPSYHHQPVVRIHHS